MFKDDSCATSVGSRSVSRSSQVLPPTCLQPSTFLSSRGELQDSDDSVGTRRALPYGEDDASLRLSEIISEKFEALSGCLQRIQLDFKPLHDAVHRIEDDIKPLRDSVKCDQDRTFVGGDLTSLFDSISRVEAMGSDALYTSKAVLDALIAMRKAPRWSNTPFSSTEASSIPPEGSFREACDIVDAKTLPGWKNGHGGIVDPRDISCNVDKETTRAEYEMISEEPNGPHLSRQSNMSEEGVAITKSGIERLAEEETVTDLTEAIRAMMVKQEMHDLYLDGTPARRKKKRRVFLERLFNVAVWWDRIEEPTRSGILFLILNSSWFETLSMVTIMTNCVFVANGADWAMQNLGEDPPFFTGAMELGFVAFYLVELVLKLAVHRFYFFVNAEMKWNWLDFVLVVSSSIDILVIWVVHGGRENANENMVFMRILRIVKLAKIFRAFRAMRFVKELVVILESLTQSLIALFWVFFMLSFMLTVFALVILQGMVEHLSTNKARLTLVEKDEIRLHFGSMRQSVLTLYMSVTGGDDWGKFYRIVEEAGVFYAAVFLFFTFFFIFALFNMLTGIFVEKTATASTPDRAELALNERRRARRNAAEFKHVCKILDKTNSGVVTWKDFQKHMRDETMASYMASIGLEIHDVEMFFNVVAGSQSGGEIAIDRFVNACMVLKGTATSIDMQQQLFEMHALTKNLKEFEETCNKELLYLRNLLTRHHVDRGDTFTTM